MDAYVLVQTVTNKWNYLLEQRPDVVYRKFKLAKSRLLKSVHVCVGLSGIYHQSYLQVLHKKRQGSKKASVSSFPNQSI